MAVNKWKLFLFELLLELLLGPVIIYLVIAIGLSLYGFESELGGRLGLRDIYYATLFFYIPLGYLFVKMYFGVIRNNSRKKHLGVMLIITIIYLNIVPVASPIIAFAINIYDLYFSNFPRFNMIGIIITISIFIGATLTICLSAATSVLIDNKFSKSVI